MHEISSADPGATILVVEDELLIQMCIAEHLRDCGYRVFEAAEVDEAIAVLDSQPDIDIVFTDVNMPGDRDGLDLARWLNINRPRVSVIVTSGRVDAAGVADDLCHAGPLIGKPYRLNDVAVRIDTLVSDRAKHHVSGTMQLLGAPATNVETS